MAKEETTQAIHLDNIKIGHFDSSIRRNSFSCGRVNIDNFLKKSAPNQHKKCHSRVYYALLGDQLIGYYCLAAASRPPLEMSEEAAEFFARINNVPCLYLGMIAVQKEFQGNGIGKKLMVHAMETTARVSDLVGIYALILQAADQEVAGRYAKWGFAYFTGEESKNQPNMFIALATIKKALQSA